MTRPARCRCAQAPGRAVLECSGVVEHQLRCGGGRVDRLPQGTCRQQPAVAGAAFVEHHQFEVTLQPQVLQAVIADQHVDARVGRQSMPVRQRPGRARPRPARRLRALQQQRGSSPDSIAVESARYRTRARCCWRHGRAKRCPGCQPPACSALTSASVVGVLPAPPTMRLPTHHHRHRQALAAQPAAPVQPAPAGHEQVHQPRQRPQQPLQRTRRASRRLRCVG